MSVTKEQADFFWMYAQDNAASDGSDAEKFADIAGDMVQEAQNEIDRLNEQLASQVSASTRNNHMRIKELEEENAEMKKCLWRVVSLMDSDAGTAIDWIVDNHHKLDELSK